jgi:hypothetical protein
MQSFDLDHKYEQTSKLWYLILQVMTMENTVLWDATLYGSCKNRRFGRIYRLHHQGEENQRVELVFLHSVLQLLVTAETVPSSLILFIVMIEVICSFETSDLTRATRRHITGDGIHHLVFPIRKFMIDTVFLVFCPQ